jgi:hypothetical protein
MPKASPNKSRAKSVLTEKQDVYVEARMDGASKTQAAKIAGYKPGASGVVEKSDDVRAALLHARSELSSATQIKRADVLEMLTEAYDMAKLAAEPASMIGAAREIGKMLGFYEPEVIKLQVSSDQAKLQRKFEVMTDEQLLEIAEGKALVVEGEFKRVS